MTKKEAHGLIAKYLSVSKANLEMAMSIADDYKIDFWFSPMPGVEERYIGGPRKKGLHIAGSGDGWQSSTANCETDFYHEDEEDE